jgi:antitoxin component YwqK of YwqJK toxin-antitoxin module
MQLILTALFTAGLQWMPSLFVSFNDPSLSTVGTELILNGKKFTGIAYELYRDKNIYRLAPVYSGQRFYKEVHWHPNGTRWVERDFKHGLPHGKFRIWYPNGKIQSITNFVNGLAHGESWSWHQNGRVTEYRLSNHGNEVAYKAFTFDGKTFYNYIYQNGERIGVQAGEFCKSARR